MTKDLRTNDTAKILRYAQNDTRFGNLIKNPSPLATHSFCIMHLAFCIKKALAGTIPANAFLFVYHHFDDLRIGLLHAHLADVAYAANGPACIVLQNAGVCLIGPALHG